MKQKETNKYKKIIGEILINFSIVNIGAFQFFDSIGIASLLQLVLLFIGDKLLRKNLVKSTRRKHWNIARWIMKCLSLLLTPMGYPELSFMLIAIEVVATRIMFHDDLDRTVQTVEELKEAYFAPTIVKTYKGLKHRAIYVLSN